MNTPRHGCPALDLIDLGPNLGPGIVLVELESLMVEDNDDMIHLCSQSLGWGAVMSSLARLTYDLFVLGMTASTPGFPRFDQRPSMVRAAACGLAGSSRPVTRGLGEWVGDLADFYADNPGTTSVIPPTPFDIDGAVVLCQRALEFAAKSTGLTDTALLSQLRARTVRGCEPPWVHS